jgi:hypothetical protein
MGVYTSGSWLWEGMPRVRGWRGLRRSSCRIALVRSRGSSPVVSMSTECGPMGRAGTSSCTSDGSPFGFGAVARAILGVGCGPVR